jgi:hypothetical protein
MKQPKRLFRDRRPALLGDDRRRVDYVGPPTVEMPDLSPFFSPWHHVVYVPVHESVRTDTYHSLRGLEDLGIRVDYSKGASAIDLTRSMLASSAILENLESMLFIDSDMKFSPEDAVKLLMSPEPVIAGVYAAKKLGDGQLNVDFGPDCPEVKLGEWAEKPYPVHKIGAGFLRIKVDFLKRMIRKLDLPFCRMAHGFGWPFFQPVTVDQGDGPTYLPEDYAFCWRCCQVGEPPQADTAFRLYHLGEYPYGWEEAEGQYIKRSRNLLSKMARPVGAPFITPDIS